MSATQTRPFVAFWLLALAAAVVLAQGLRVEAAQVLVRAGVPLPIAGVLTPDLLLGQSLVGRPSATAAQDPSALGLRLQVAALQQQDQHQRQPAAVAAPRAGQVLHPATDVAPRQRSTLGTPQTRPPSGAVGSPLAAHGKSNGVGKRVASGQRSTGGWSGHKGGSKVHKVHADKVKGKAKRHGKSRRR